MKMIIGGAFQGKYTYGKKMFQIKNWIDGDTCSLEDLYTAEGIRNFHRFIRRMLINEQNIAFIVEKLITSNPQVIIIMDEVGSGIVPMEPFEREYRETVGRAGTRLAEESNEVHRVMCGIGTVIKSV